MTQISKYPISRKIYDRIFGIFLKTISSLYSQKETEKFLSEFLTPTEQVMLSKRLAIGFLLAKEYKYREISKILRVSTTTINRISLAYKHGHYFQSVIHDILMKEKLKEFWLNVGSVMSGALSKGGKGTAGWRNLKVEIEEKKRNKVF